VGESGCNTVEEEERRCQIARVEGNLVLEGAGVWGGVEGWRVRTRP